jgi:hypothetical protein
MTTAVSPLDGKIHRVKGGYRLEGQWQFSSGIDAAEWVLSLDPWQANQEYGRPGSWSTSVTSRSLTPGTPLV